MATNKMRPIHPGEILREEFLVPLGMSANALAMELRVPVLGSGFRSFTYSGMWGRVTASVMAAASAASFLSRLPDMR